MRSPLHAAYPPLALALAISSGASPAARPLGERAQPAATPPVVAIQPNDNRRAAGRLANGVLTVALEARAGTWEPDGRGGPILPVAAFAERGRDPETPGPLLRAPVGTEVRATVTNSLDKSLWLYGMGAARGFGDSVQIAAGARRELRFRLGEEGTFYYAARTGPAPVAGRTTDDSQLHGAIVVDPVGAPKRPRDRVFVISNWFTIDTTTVSGLGAHATLSINGRVWPTTERIDARQGDTLRWRVINMTPLEHPMHLHGFYYLVDARGDGRRDTLVAPEARRRVVTELVMPAQTMSLSFVPVRPGNWVFHCHFASHISAREALEKDRRHPDDLPHAMPASHAHGATTKTAGARGGDIFLGDMRNHMQGLVLGIHVQPRGPQAVSTASPRAMRLVVRSRPRVYGSYAGYAFVLGGSPEEANPDTMPVPGPTLVLRRDEPVAITIVNRSHDDAAVHWHGIELESFPDGVPGWSGMGRTLLPMIAPGDSFTVRFTPPRAGTFMYHSHSNEFQQIASGLYGAIIVLDPGAALDPATDRLLLFSDGGPTINFLRAPPPALLNGHVAPDTLQLRPGVAHRLRIVNIRTDFIMTVALLEGEVPATWRPLAKDGADLPASQSTLRPAEVTLAPGEIWDMEVIPKAGPMRLRYGTLGSRAAPTIAAVEVR